ncbi:hypothetical protein R2601_03543 [Salipiger bermudensis HTCC2601]|uniref:Uncharacterized protein n=1 Tax=Salipiger bermudensis (strain DSM 26914 / JCM 13377 / KCTC 12554 / HTCC2601) TaxID=314265 RepID=Q0FWD7_SALBH|nr:hypothetical protein R2601_03543 [Salipiger bermudensis HTCC2601]
MAISSSVRASSSNLSSMPPISSCHLVT